MYMYMYIYSYSKSRIIVGAWCRTQFKNFQDLSKRI